MFLLLFAKFVLWFNVEKKKMSNNSNSREGVQINKSIKSDLSKVKFTFYLKRVGLWWFEFLYDVFSTTNAASPWNIDSIIIPGERIKWKCLSI